ncbi:MAG: PfaD family polyunsaturated fatty acid/polyketide biosynthesis protein [Rhodospirillaceae bacterium]|nr:PfaD family polyunsaturated fatty acid/polyketide biosynthesis protein [Rhodospirillaceae bacterium]
MVTLESLGSADFKRRHGLRHAYVAGSMVRGISSVEMVINMARAGFLGYFGTGALHDDAIEEALLAIKAGVSDGQSWGMNLLNNATNPQAEMDTVNLFLRHNVTRVEASAYMQITPALVVYRAKGLRPRQGGGVDVENLLLAKLSRPEIATIFMEPAPEKIVKNLLDEDLISQLEAELLCQVPMADDICVEADSGGHTDMGVMATLLPTICRLRDELSNQHGYDMPICVGGAGGIGTPEAAATAYILGADFILTGSINQCTVESGTSDAVKDILQQINIQDTDYCPSGSLFELGAKTQVVKKGVFFPARAKKLYDLWKNHNSLDEIDPKTRIQIEEKYFKRSFEDVWDETFTYYKKAAPEEAEKAAANPKQKMAMIFRWYFVHTMRLAMDGTAGRKIDYQIHCGPALGAFNQWVKGTELDDWRNRRVAEIGLRLLEDTAELLNQRFAALSSPAQVHSISA